MSSRPSEHSSFSAAAGVKRVKRQKISSVVADDIRSRIRAGEWEPGDPLPSEFGLAAEYAVARGTIRTAIQELATQGWVVTKHGVGSYVTQMGQSVATNIAELTSMTDIIVNAGMEAYMNYTARRSRPAGEVDARRFGIGEDDLVYETRRQVEADGAMAAISFDILRADIFPQGFHVDTLAGSLFKYLESIGYPIAYADTGIHAVVGEDLGLHLEARYESFLGLYQLHFTVEGTPVFYSRTFFRESFFEFSLMRKRKG
ncbi:GntR family transcriptional regulator [Trueperella sp. LYQ143]|uniref:GntR family transcriptional regulator n=1 Tax=unclassified Trueperella TaxID=2630174 RepID=UPI003983D6A4